MPIHEFRARIYSLVDHVKASEHASGVEQVLNAGEPEARRKADRLRDGIPVSQVVLEELHATAQTLGVRADLG